MLTVQFDEICSSPKHSGFQNFTRPTLSRYFSVVKYDDKLDNSDDKLIILVSIPAIFLVLIFCGRRIRRYSIYLQTYLMLIAICEIYPVYCGSKGQDVSTFITLVRYTFDAKPSMPCQSTAKPIAETGYPCAKASSTHKVLFPFLPIQV